MSGPGCDQPKLSENLIKNKVASSISHLYQRPRVWLEGFHSSGWGTNSADITRATIVNFIQGDNLLSLHGLYYSTHGGWWEWAPPCNHFRMPYWQHIVPLMNCVQRMGYLLSQGVHQCDVAILYPIAAMEAGMNGEKAKNVAFDAGTKLYHGGYDFDFMDFESLARAEVKDEALHVSGETYRVLVLPSMQAIRFSTLERALELYRHGGIVILIGDIPEASDHLGSNDPKIKEILEEIFGPSIFKPDHRAKGFVQITTGTDIYSPDAKQLSSTLRRYLTADVSTPSDTNTLSDFSTGHKQGLNTFSKPREAWNYGIPGTELPKP